MLRQFYKSVKICEIHELPNIHMNVNLCFKSCILVPDYGPRAPKQVTFTDDIIKSLLCFTVIHTPMLITAKI